MEDLSYEQLMMIAHEGLIRRAAEIDLPLMLKGSYVTRQYFPNPANRTPADLDWVYLNPINDVETATTVFNDCMFRITELELNDGISFKSFRQNQFWRRIDYAMADDFPTVNTDLECWINGKKVEFGLDISFNLKMDETPIPLKYYPILGKPFIVPYSVPLSLQVSWKIHQTIVRPRFKDLFDLIYLVQHPDFDRETLLATKKELINECIADNLDLHLLNTFFHYDIEDLFRDNSINYTWQYWRHGIRPEENWKRGLLWNQANEITNPEKLPFELSDFLAQFKEALESKGLDPQLISDLNIPYVRKEPEPEIEPLPEPKEKVREYLGQRSYYWPVERKLTFWERLLRRFR